VSFLLDYFGLCFNAHITNKRVFKPCVPWLKRVFNCWYGDNRSCGDTMIIYNTTSVTTRTILAWRTVSHPDSGAGEALVAVPPGANNADRHDIIIESTARDQVSTVSEFCNHTL